MYAGRLAQTMTFRSSQTADKDLPKAVTLLLLKDGKVLSVSRKDNPKDLGLPGGKVDSGETLLQAAARELKEETGVDAMSVTHVFEAVSSSGEYYSYTFQVMAWEGEPYSVEDGIVAWVDPEVLIAPSQMFSDYNKALFTHVGLV